MIATETQSADPAATWASTVFKYERQFDCCGFSPCGKNVFAGAYDGTVQRWTLDGDEQTAGAGHHGWVTDLAFHPDGVHLFSVDTWGRPCCRAYASADLKPKWDVPQAHANWIRALAVSPDGALVATAGNDQVVRLWNAADGKPVRDLAGHASEIYSLAFHPTDGSLVSGDLTGVVKHWNVTTGKPVRDIDASVLYVRQHDLYDSGAVRDLAFSGDGQQLVCSGITNLKGSTVAGFPGVVQIDWKSGKQTELLRPKDHEVEYKVHGVFVEGVTFHSDGFLIGVGGNGERAGAMWFWKLDGAEPFHEIQKLPGGRDISIHPDGLRLAVAQFEPNGRGINGGNGRKTKEGEYYSHDGVVRIYEMTPRPEKAGDAKPKG